MPDLRIADVRVTPIAFYDPPLLNNAGCHQPFALRSIIEVETEDGVVGLGESYGTSAVLGGLAALAPACRGFAVTDLNGLWQRTRETLPPGSDVRLLLRVGGAVEVAMWDALGKATGQRVVDMLGGQVRARVPFSAYLFYKFAGHAGEAADDWGEVLSPEQLVDEARRMADEHGFRAIKLKAGVLEPEAEVAGLEALREAFPDSPLRIDPNGGWHVHTALDLLPRLEGLVEYLEDPTVGIAGNAVVQAATDVPLATNMYVVEPSHLPPNMAQDGFRVILSDHHYWGGLKASRDLAEICRIWGLGLSMHSNSHLGISLAAMVHLAAATPNLTYDCDTHSPWQVDEVIEGGKLRFEGGALRLPEGPGLGVTLDRVALARLQANFEALDYRDRDDASEMRKHWPNWQFGRPKF
ncbi:enolase C-terminal domain-like protein [Psychromarinibacter sp. C21-152]|uniref:glucarate dehydratase n=1 Tax=Psychromarinibacter sediminicola TaxID=3033385 RepID=A0AAE3NWX4_9RHOB|nr:enolase C-terminal domain-like protein [Psychromarinibacter sediminicola]MDF0603739.1 enolase C-terminal domain-like protein [Psychromarinibacter sediminicola]